MKTIDSKSYKYIGTDGPWHVFARRYAEFDPEVVKVMRARYLLDDGRSIYFDPRLDEEPTSYQMSTNLRGVTKDGIEYCMAVAHDVPVAKTAVGVIKSECEGRNREWIDAKFNTLVKCR